MKYFEKDFFQIPYSLVDDLIKSLSGGEIKLYIALKRLESQYANPAMVFYTTDKRLSEITGFKRRNIIELRKRLEQKGIIRTEQRKDSSLQYEIIDDIARPP